MTILIMQSFNFLSLSVGSDGLKVDNNYNKIEPLSKFQVPYLQSLAQQYGVMPLHSQYASTSYQTQLSVAAPQVLMLLGCWRLGAQLIK